VENFLEYSSAADIINIIINNIDLVIREESLYIQTTQVHSYESVIRRSSILRQKQEL